MTTSNNLRETTFIYALKCPIRGVPRYVGKADDLEERYKQHLRACKKKRTHRDHWVANLLLSGHVPDLEILDEVPSSEWGLWEQEWIRLYTALGFPLTNATKGGEGCVGTPETREKISRSKKGKPLHPNTRLAQRLKMTGSKHTEEHKAAISATLQGRPKSDIHCASLRKVKRSDNSSGAAGVSYHKVSKRWRSRITVRGVEFVLGYFIDFFDAVCARKIAENDIE